MAYDNIIKSFSQDRHILGRVLPLDTPYTIYIDISDVCNLRCKYCFRYDESIEAEDYRKNRLMEWDTFVRIVEQMKEFPGQFKRIALSHHGEPLCNRLLPKMARYIKASGLTGKTDIHTNAVLLDEPYIDELCAAGLDRIVISVQGLNEKKYLEECGAKIDFDQFYQTIKLLYKKKNGTQIHIKTVDEAVDGERERFYELFSPVADRVFVESVVPLWTGADLSENHCEINKYGDTVPIQKCCPLVFYTINVLPDGTIYPCGHIRPPFKLGNVHDTTLSAAWNSKEKQELFRRMLEHGRFELRECGTCYVPQNTVMASGDSIDGYAEEILQRLLIK